MHPNVLYGGGTTSTFMSPVVLTAMLLACLLILVLPRRTAIIPFLLFVFLTPLGQNFNVNGLHFFAQRIVILCGCARLLASAFRSSRGMLAGGLNIIDKLFLLWAIWRSLAVMLLYQDVAAMVNQMGFLWDFLGGYFLVRCLIRDREDIIRTAKVLVVIAAIMAGCMVYEHATAQNVFGVLMGGRTDSDIRNGQVRARGVFGQQILAGTFGGTLIPLFLWLWRGGRSKVLAVVGLVSATVITVTASSSTGVSAFLAGVAALCAWPLRRYMRPIRWGLVFAIAGLTVVMKAPVWYLMARVDFTGGSTGWDRAFLVDQTVRHIGDWWLVGTKDNAYWGNDTWDLCNQFVAEAVQAGLATLVLFTALVARSFGSIGTARKRAEGDPEQERLLWMLGALLTAHLAGFFGISYFDQTRVWWFTTLAMVSAAIAHSAEPIAAAEQPQLEIAAGRFDWMENSRLEEMR